MSNRITTNPKVNLAAGEELHITRKDGEITMVDKESCLDVATVTIGGMTLLVRYVKVRTPVYRKKRKSPGD